MYENIWNQAVENGLYEGTVKSSQSSYHFALLNEGYFFSLIIGGSAISSSEEDILSESKIHSAEELQSCIDGFLTKKRNQSRL